jgi:putative DNA primase/helicase
MWTGYYSNFKQLATFLDEWDDGNIEACYICTNPADPSKVVVTNSMEKGQQSLKHDGVLYRHNLLIDIDTIKASDIATEGEKEKSAEIRDMIVEFLLDQAFPEPLVAGSGNGWHLIYRLPDLPPNDENMALVERVQRYLKQNFSVEGVCKIDVFKDANRLTRVYGTYNRKGKKLEGQEYWQSTVVSYPDEMEPIKIDALKMVASLVPALVEHKKAVVESGDDAIEDWMMEEALDKYVEAGRFDGYDMVSDGVWNLYSCPWEFEHSTEVGNGTVQVSLIGGIPGFNDLRASCFSADDKGGGKRTWIDFRNKCDPDRTLYKFPVEQEEDEDYSEDENIEIDGVFEEENRCYDKLPVNPYAKVPLTTMEDVEKSIALSEKLMEPVLNRELKEELAEQQEEQFGAEVKEKDVLKAIVSQDRNDGSRINLVICYASDVKITKLDWLWDSKLPAGKIILFTGKPGGGKSTACADIVARTTTGADWPDGKKNTLGPKKVLMACAEDDYADTVVPRLTAAGADLSKVMLIPMMVEQGKQKMDKEGDPLKRTRKRVTLDLKAHAKLFIELVKKEPDVALLVLDPITSFFGKADQNKDSDIRPLMDELKRVCEKSGITLIGLIHGNKRSDVDSQQKILGASSIVGSARAVWGFTIDPEDKNQRTMAHIKGNLSKETKGMQYTLGSVDVALPDGTMANIGKTIWGDEVDMDADDILNAERQKAKENRVDFDTKAILATAIIRDNIPGLARNIYAKGEKEGINERTMQRARGKMGVTMEQQPKGPWWWWKEGDPKPWEEVPEQPIIDISVVC